MYLWLLKEVKEGSWDSYDSFLIRADCECKARVLANETHGSEGPIWVDSKASTCERISDKGKEEILISSYNAG